MSCSIEFTGTRSLKAAAKRIVALGNFLFQSAEDRARALAASPVYDGNRKELGQLMAHECAVLDAVLSHLVCTDCDHFSARYREMARRYGLRVIDWREVAA